MKNITLAGISTVAVTYGLARLSLGLFLPEISASLNLSEPQAGFVGTLGYLSYVLALFFSNRFIQRSGTFRVVQLTGLSAVIGLIGISLSPNLILLCLSVLIAGLGSGWASTVFSNIVRSHLPEQQQDNANTWINTGTSFGIVLSGPISLLFPGQWQIVFLFFAFLASLTLLFNSIVLPKTQPSIKTDPHKPFDLFTVLHKTRHLIFASLLIGFSTSIFWTFSRSYLSAIYQWNEYSSILFWILMGAAGIAGSFAGRIVQLKGLRFSFKLVSIILSFSIGIIVVPSSITILLSAVLFGTTYIAITGLLLIWGTRYFSDSPDAGVSLSFLALGLGQALGSSVAGLSIDVMSYPISFLLFALLCGLALFVPVKYSSISY